MSKRSRHLRFAKRITGADAPQLAAGHVSVKVIQPEQACCPCCSDCPTPDAHDDGGCVLPSHRVTDWSTGWIA